MSYRMSGRFITAGVAAGTVRLRVAGCDMGQLTWRAADPAASGGSGRQGGGATYAGYYSQRSRHIDVRLPIVLRLTPSGQAVAGAAGLVNVMGPGGAACAHLSGLWQVWFGHRFRHRFRDREHFDVPGPQAGQIGVIDITWGGRFGARKMTGTWDETGELKARSSGMVLARCSARLTWQARRVSG